MGTKARRNVLVGDYCRRHDALSQYSDWSWYLQVCLRIAVYVAMMREPTIEYLKFPCWVLIHSISALNVSQLLRDFTIPHPEEVHTSHVTWLSIFTDPMVNPADHAAVPNGEHFLDQADFPEHLNHQDASNYKTASWARQLAEHIWSKSAWRKVPF